MLQTDLYFSKKRLTKFWFRRSQKIKTDQVPSNLQFCEVPEQTPPHEQNCSTWASPRTELLYLGFPTNRITSTNRFATCNSVRGKPQQAGSVCGEGQVEQIFSLGSPERAVLLVGFPGIAHLFVGKAKAPLSQESGSGNFKNFKNFKKFKNFKTFKRPPHEQNCST